MRYGINLLLVMLAVGAGLAADAGRGRELYSEGKYDEAITELRQVVNEQADNADANRLLGLALIEDGKESEAEKYINKANEVAPSPETKLAMARLAVAQKNIDRAEEMLNGAGGDDLDYVKGLVDLNRGRNQEAVDALEGYLGKNPNHAYAHYYAGMAYNGLKRPDKMLTHFETFLKLKPDAPEARKVRAVVRTGR